MRLGILETVGLAGSLVFAIPAALLGVELVLGDRPAIGAVLLVVAALMVLLPRVVTTPDEVPATAAERAAERVLGAEGDDEDDAPGAGDGQ